MTIQQQLDKAKSEELLTVEQFALLAQYDPKTVYRKVARKEIPGVVRYGRSIRFRRAAVMGFLEGRHVALAARLSERYPDATFQ